MADDPSSSVAAERRFARARGLRGRNLVQRVTGRDVRRSGGNVQAARDRVARTGQSLLTNRTPLTQRQINNRVATAQRRRGDRVV